MSENLVYICEICQVPLEERLCDFLCPNCGRMLDCNDLPLVQAYAKLIENERLVMRPGNDPRDLLPQLHGDEIPVTPGLKAADLP